MSENWLDELGPSETDMFPPNLCEDGSGWLNDLVRRDMDTPQPPAQTNSYTRTTQPSSYPARMNGYARTTQPSSYPAQTNGYTPQHNLPCRFLTQQAMQISELPTLVEERRAEPVWTDSLGANRRALRERAVLGEANRYLAANGASTSRAVSMDSSSDTSMCPSTSGSSQSGKADSSCSSQQTDKPVKQRRKKRKRNREGQKQRTDENERKQRQRELALVEATEAESDRRKRPCEFAVEEMNAKKRTLGNLDITEVDLNDGTEPMVLMTQTAYMKLASKRADPQGPRAIADVLPGAFTRLARKGNMADVWKECVLCGATEASKRLMKAHYQAHLPTTNPIAIMLGECDKIGQMGLGTNSMAPEENQQASFRLSLSLWHQYSVMLSSKRAVPL